MNVYVFSCGEGRLRYYKGDNSSADLQCHRFVLCLFLVVCKTYTYLGLFSLVTFESTLVWNSPFRWLHILDFKLQNFNKVIVLKQIHWEVLLGKCDLKGFALILIPLFFCFCFSVGTVSMFLFFFVYCLTLQSKIILMCFACYCPRRTDRYNFVSL